MKTILSLLCALFCGLTVCETGLAAEPFVITDSFLSYLKQTTNPYGFGLRADGRFYPYSSPQGRRIGYMRSIDDKELYRNGCTKEEAEAQLRAGVEKALVELTAYMDENYADHPFQSLSRKSQEMLVDFAFSAGARDIPPAFYSVVIREDWSQLFNSFVYLRWVEKGWPDTIKNKAFADRWLDPQWRLRP